MDRLVVGLSYRGVVQNCLKKVKYKSAWDVIKFLHGLCQFEDALDGVITSVPMWKPKERMRGFNQAKILAELIGNHVDLLERVRETRPMFGLSKKERLENIEGAFELLNHLNITPLNQRVVLVDDVWTTGATMRECAKVLKKAGVREVWGVTLAR
jgi:ComF family protein